jgi:hypothetical protein
MIFKLTEISTTRTKTKFLILPIKINREIRWLETVKIEQGYYQCNGDLFPRWKNLSFMKEV